MPLSAVILAMSSFSSTDILMEKWSRSIISGPSCYKWFHSFIMAAPETVLSIAAYWSILLTNSLSLFLSSFVFLSIQVIFSILLQIQISKASSPLLSACINISISVWYSAILWTRYIIFFFNSEFRLPVLSHPRISFYLLSLCCQFSCQNIHLLICDCPGVCTEALTHLFNQQSISLNLYSAFFSQCIHNT